MKIRRSGLFKDDYGRLPAKVQQRAGKQLRLLLQNWQHPSLRVKKIQGAQGIWEGRVNRSYRFTFEMEDDVILLRRIGTHDILNTP